jgi:RHS repeat-associated protein
VHAVVRRMSFLSDFIHLKPRYVRRTAWVAVLVLLGSLLTGVTFASTADAVQKSPASKAVTSCSASSSSDATTATMLAKKCRKAVSITADQSAYTQMSANANGTMTYTSSATPRWVQQSGSWVSVNADLVGNKDGSFSPKAAESGLKFSGGGNTALATAASSQGSMTVSWPTKLPVPSVSAASATYANVLPGVNLVVTAEATGGFEESLIVENAAAAKDPGLAKLVLGMSLSKGLTSRTDKAGNLTVENFKGKAVFTSPAPRAWDSSKHAKPVAVPVSYQAGKATMAPPRSLLDSKSAVFPVTIDPTYTVTQAWEGYDETQSAYPTAEEFNSTYNGDVSVGDDGGGIDRGYYVFGLPSAAQGSTTDVISATVTLTAVADYSSSYDTHDIDAYYTSQATSTIDWNSPPTNLAGPEAVDFATTSTTPSVSVPVNVAPWVQTQLDSYSFQFSLGLINTDESDTTGFVEFAPYPTLSITYDQAPYQIDLRNVSLSPQNWAVDGDLYTSSLTPSFQAWDNDPIGNEIEYEFKLEDGSTVVEDQTTGYYASGATASITSSATLSDLTTYELYVRAYDGTEYGGWSTPLTFETEHATPPAPSVSCSGYASNTWTALISGGTTCSVSDSSSLVEGFSYKLEDGTTSSDDWSWISGSSGSISVDPTTAGLYTLTVSPLDDAGVYGASATYVFGVGTSGALLSPPDGSQTASSVTLQAAAPGTYTSATFEYRLGTTGSFTAIPNHVTVDSCGCAVTWPVATTTNSAGVQTATLTWYLNRTIADDGLVQVETVFTKTGGTLTTPPVSVSLSRTGSGADYGTTAAGPVSVGLQSGNAALSANDVGVSSYGAGLSVGRTFNSVNPSATGIFGPGWVSSVGSTQASSWASVIDDTTYAVLTAGDGSTYTFTEGSTSGSTVSYSADADAVSAGLTLTKNTSSHVFELTDSSNDVTTFSYSTADADYAPSTVTSPGTTSSTGIVYNSSGNPLLLVAPDAASSEAPTTACPSPVSSSTWTAGCRGLEFDYNSSGDVSEIDFVYVDNSGTYHDTAVAKYGYDSSGRLTSEWDPRLSTPLVTGYTYDETSTDADYGRITAYSPAQAAGSSALASWHFTYDDTATDVNYGKILTVSRTHSSSYGGGAATDTIDYEVPLTTAVGGPVNMDATTVGSWAETDVPTSAVAVWPGGYTPSSTTSPTATDYEYATVDYYDANGRQVNTASYVNGAWAVSTTQYDGSGNVTSTLTAADRATALNAASSAAEAQALSTINVYACDDFGTIGTCTSADQSYEVETDTYGPAHSVNVDGTLEIARDHTAYAYDAGAPNSDRNASGVPYMLQTSVTSSASVGSTVPGTSTADSRTTEYVYANGSDDTGWTLGEPLQTITDPSGLDVISTTAYNESSSLYNGDNLVIDQDQPSDSSGGTAGDTHTVYYTAGTNSQVSSCGDKPEWANLVCETYPAAQPSDTSTIPTTTYTYNNYLSTLTETKTYGSTGTETITTTYDAENRPTEQAVTVSGTGMGTAPSTTAEVYSANSGMPTGTQALNSSGAVTSDIATEYDDFAQPISYTDGNNETTTYTYNLSGQPTSNATPYDTDTLTYSPGGQAVSEHDSLAGTFTATYNPDETLQTQTYPDGTVATYGIDSAGTATQLTYTNSNWVSPITDSGALNAQGDWASESVLNDSKTYTYDNDDRLTAVNDTDAGSCTTRDYTYDADSNRASLTTYVAASGGACQATTATTTEDYSYDAADRLESTTESGTTADYTYDAQGDITTTPSVDAGGSGALTATYYANGMLDTQTQAGTTGTYTLDATLGRYATETSSSTGYTTVSDYSDSSNSPAWSTTNGSWTANVTGLDGGLDAEATESGTVTLELTDLHGDILATVNPSSDSAPSATFAYTEFGTPEAGSGSVGTYGYLGADGIAGSGVGDNLLMGARGYNPSLGRFDSTDPVFEGSANAYDYGAQNPVTNLDLSGNAYCTADWGCFTHSGSWRDGLFGWGINFNQALIIARNIVIAWTTVEVFICALIGIGSGGIAGAVCALLLGLVHQVFDAAISNIADDKVHFSAKWFEFDYGLGRFDIPYIGEHTYIYH